MSAQINLSFEFFPPKTPEGLNHLTETLKQLAAFKPQFFSVTFGAGGSTQSGTVETITRLQQHTDIPISPHLSCRGLSREQLITLIKQYQSLGFKRIVALRGDLPSGMGSSVGEIPYANELVRLIRDATQQHFHVSVAAYPEVHPEAKDVQDNLLCLKRKMDAGANSAITQYFFNADAYFYFLDDCARQGITIPIIPGIMPITNFAKLARFSALCGAEIPLYLKRRLEFYQDDEQALTSFGFSVVQTLCQRLLAGGAPGLHFYTLNHAAASVEVVRGL